MQNALFPIFCCRHLTRWCFLFYTHFFLLLFPSHCHPGSGGSREEQRGSAPRGAKDVAFSSKHLQPAGVYPRCPPVLVEHQTLYHLSGNGQCNWHALLPKNAWLIFIKEQTAWYAIYTINNCILYYFPTFSAQTHFRFEKKIQMRTDSKRAKIHFCLGEAGHETQCGWTKCKSAEISLKWRLERKKA